MKPLSDLSGPLVLIWPRAMLMSEVLVTTEACASAYATISPLVRDLAPPLLCPQHGYPQLMTSGMDTKSHPPLGRWPLGI